MFFMSIGNKIQQHFPGLVSGPITQLKKIVPIAEKSIPHPIARRPTRTSNMQKTISRKSRTLIKLQNLKKVPYTRRQQLKICIPHNHPPKMKRFQLRINSRNLVAVAVHYAAALGYNGAFGAAAVVVAAVNGKKRSLKVEKGVGSSATPPSGIPYIVKPLMGKRKSSATKAKNTAAAGYSLYDGHQNTSKTLREESSGKQKQKPSLGAFFGNRLALTVEALSVPPDPNLFSCQRCESILQPGFNCTVRIEKQQHKGKKLNRATQNNVVYHCHFCSHRNLKRGTPKNYMKEIYVQKPKSRSKTVVDMVKNVEKIPKTEVLKESSKDIVSCQEIVTDEPSTPMITRKANNNSTLLELRTKKRNRSGSRKTVESVAINEAEKSSCINTAISSKKKRKSWTSLKEIAERSTGQDDTRSFVNLKMPFLI